MHKKLPNDGRVYNGHNGSNRHNTQIAVWGFQCLVPATKSVSLLDFCVFACILKMFIRYIRSLHFHTKDTLKLSLVSEFNGYFAHAQNLGKRVSPRGLALFTPTV